MPEHLVNAVQPQGWYSSLPRSAYAQWEKIDAGDSWFEVYRLPGRVYAIYEPGHFQEVISFLICGNRHSLLLDTGLGIGNIKATVERLVDHEPLVVNSHFHFDHIGNNNRFSSVSIFNEPFAINRLKKGFTREELKEHLAGDSVWIPYPEEFDPDNYCIPPVTPQVLEDGDVFDLGDRVLEVIHTPGHTADSIMLLDKKNRSLFTGDTFYPAALYAHFNDDCCGHSDLALYASTMKKLTGFVPSLDYLYCSHNIPLVEPTALNRAAEAFQRVLAGRAPYKLDQQGLRRYEFTDFAIITKD